MHGVDLREQHVVVVKIGGGIYNPLVLLEENEIQRNLLRISLVCEERIGVDEEGRPRFGVEVEYRSNAAGEISPECSGGRRVRGLEDAQGVGGGDADLLVEPKVDQGRVDALHSRKEVVAQRRVVEGQNFVADEDAGDFGGGEELLDVGFDPSLSLCRILDLGQVIIAQTHDEFHAGVCECLENPRICVVKLHPCGSNGLHERDYVLWGWQIVRNLAVVYPN